MKVKDVVEQLYKFNYKLVSWQTGNVFPLFTFESEYQTIDLVVKDYGLEVDSNMSDEEFERLYGTIEAAYNYDVDYLHVEYPTPKIYKLLRESKNTLGIELTKSLLTKILKHE